MKEIFGVILGIIAVVLLGWFLTANGIFMKEKLGVWDANVDRKIFEESKSYVHGTIQTLQDYKLQYELAETEAHKSALREAILSEWAAFKYKDKVNGSLYSFIQSL